MSREAGFAGPVVLEADSPAATRPRTKIPVEAIALASIFLGAIGQLTVKASLLAVSALHADPHIMLRVGAPALGLCTGLAIYGAGTLFWLKAVSKAAISYLYPLTASSYALVAIGGKWILGEHIRQGRWIGIAIIMFGVAMLAASGAGVRSDAADSISR